MANVIEILTRLSGVPQVQAGLKDLERGVQGTGTAANATAGGMTKLSGAMTAVTRAAVGLVAVGGAVALLQRAHRAADEAERAHRRLTSTLDVMGASFRRAGELASATAEALEARTGQSAEALTDAFGALLRVTGDYGRSLSLLRTAADIAATGQTSLEGAALALGRAAAGETDALKRLVGTLDETKTASEQLADVQRRFAGQAEASATATDKLAVAWGNFLKALGGTMAVLTPVLSGLADLLNKVGPLLRALTFQETPAERAFERNRILFGPRLAEGLAAEDRDRLAQAGATLTGTGRPASLSRQEQALAELRAGRRTRGEQESREQLRDLQEAEAREFDFLKRRDAIATEELTIFTDLLAAKREAEFAYAQWRDALHTEMLADVTKVIEAEATRAQAALERVAGAMTRGERESRQQMQAVTSTPAPSAMLAWNAGLAFVSQAVTVLAARDDARAAEKAQRRREDAERRFVQALETQTRALEDLFGVGIGGGGASIARSQALVMGTPEFQRAMDVVLAMQASPIEPVRRRGAELQRDLERQSLGEVSRLSGLAASVGAGPEAVAFALDTDQQRRLQHELDRFVGPTMTGLGQQAGAIETILAGGPEAIIREWSRVDAFFQGLSRTLAALGETFEQSLRNGFRLGIERFLDGSGSLLMGLREGLRAAIQQAVISAIVEGVVVEAMVGPYLERLREAVLHGTEDPVAVMREIGGQIPQWAVDLQRLVAPLVPGLAAIGPSGGGGSGVVSIPSFAHGGYVASPTLAVVGDAPGGEWLLPGGRSGPEITVHATLEVDGDVLARVVRRRLPSQVRLASQAGR